MRRAAVYYKKQLAGYLVETEWGQYIFRYEDNYFLEPTLPPISVTFAKTQQEYVSKNIFPFFCNRIAEGQWLRNIAEVTSISETDFFGMLCATSQADAIGSITMVEI